MLKGFFVSVHDVALFAFKRAHRNALKRIQPSRNILCPLSAIILCWLNALQVLPLFTSNKKHTFTEKFSWANI